MKILIATQSEINFINENDNFYAPIIVGANNCDLKKVKYYSDNTGDNISDKNPYYCELTALYWAWKNLSVEYIGLSHYRRFFLFNYKSIFNLDRLPINNTSNDFLDKIFFDKDKFKKILNKYDVILPKQKKLLLSVREDFYRDKVCYKKDFDIMEQVVLEKYPEYLDSVSKVFDGNKMYHFNMFLMNKERFDKYMEWLFDILFECENRIDISNYSKVESRVLAFLSERLFTLYIHHNKFSRYEVSVGYINSQHRIFKFLKTKNYKIIESFYLLLYFADKYFNIKKKKNG